MDGSRDTSKHPGSGTGWGRAASAAAVTGTLTALLLGAAWADAARRPTHHERGLIVKAVKTSPLTDAVPDGDYDVRGVRVSTVRTPHRRYARVTLVPRPGVNRDGGTGVLRRRSGHWRLIDLGTSGTGCRTLPAAVRADLGIGGSGDPCP